MGGGTQDDAIKEMIRRANGGDFLVLGASSESAYSLYNVWNILGPTTFAVNLTTPRSWLTATEGDATLQHHSIRSTSRTSAGSSTSSRIATSGKTWRPRGAEVAIVTSNSWPCVVPEAIVSRPAWSANTPRPGRRK